MIAAPAAEDQAARTPPMFDLHGKVALVTGASRGLGWAMAASLAQAGAHVVLNARDPAALAARVAELQARGLSGEAMAFDVSDSAAAEQAVADIATRHGRFDILVANAGINPRAGAELRCLSRSHCRIAIAVGCGYPSAGVVLRAVSERHGRHGHHKGQP